VEDTHGVLDLRPISSFDESQNHRQIGTGGERARVFVPDYQSRQPIALDAIQGPMHHLDHAFVERVHLAVELEHRYAAAGVEQRRIIRLL
jgi:hypothetical protein